MEEPAGILRCKVKKLPTVYLGMPLGNKHIFHYLGWNFGKDGKEVGKLEDTIPVSSRSTQFDKCSSGLVTHICDASVVHSYKRGQEVGPIKKAFSLVWEQGGKRGIS